MTFFSYFTYFKYICYSLWLLYSLWLRFSQLMHSREISMYSPAANCRVYPNFCNAIYLLCFLHYLSGHLQSLLEFEKEKRNMWVLALLLEHVYGIVILLKKLNRWVSVFSWFRFCGSSIFLPWLMSYFNAPQHTHHQVVFHQSNTNHSNVLVSLPITFCRSTFDLLEAKYQAV